MHHIPIFDGETNLYDHCKECDTFKYLDERLLNEGLLVILDPSYEYIVKYDCMINNDRQCHPDAKSAYEWSRDIAIQVNNFIDQGYDERVIIAWLYKTLDEKHVRSKRRDEIINSLYRCLPEI